MVTKSAVRTSVTLPPAIALRAMEGQSYGQWSLYPASQAVTMMHPAARQLAALCGMDDLDSILLLNMRFDNQNIHFDTNSHDLGRHVHEDVHGSRDRVFIACIGSKSQMTRALQKTPDDRPPYKYSYSELKPISSGVFYDITDVPHAPPRIRPYQTLRGKIFVRIQIARDDYHEFG